MTTDPRDAEIARLTAELSDMRNGWEKSVRAHAEVLAERDAALAQVAGAYEEAATEAAVEVAAHGASELAPFLRRKIRALTPADALAALSRHDAQMRAEGYRIAAAEAVKLGAHIVAPEHCPALAAAEKTND